MREYKLTTQINLIFSAVTLLGGVLFLLILTLTFNRGFTGQNKSYLEQYFKLVESEYDPEEGNFSLSSEFLYNDYLIVHDNQDKDVFTSSNNSNIPNSEKNEVREIINKYLESNTNRVSTINYTRLKGISYLGKYYGQDDYSYVIIVMSNTNKYVKDMTGNVPFYASLAFLNVMVLGNIIIWLWSSNSIKKISDLQSKVDLMIKEDYQETIDIEAAYEIKSLAKAIDNMRNEIRNNEQTKREMMQNLGHDLKTPIAVIRSYAEAILDGVEEKESLNVIIEQSDKLNNKVKQIIDYNIMGLISDVEECYNESFAEIVNKIKNNYKHLAKTKLITSIESDWIWPMIKENVYNSIVNIVDNAVRYANEQIVIRLQDKKLTIFNDGEPIEKEVLPKIFRAYEKGTKGEFGLGLAIAKETLLKYKLELNVDNHEHGVIFTITPK